MLFVTQDDIVLFISPWAYLSFLSPGLLISFSLFLLSITGMLGPSQGTPPIHNQTEISREMHNIHKKSSGLRWLTLFM